MGILSGSRLDDKPLSLISWSSKCRNYNELKIQNITDLPIKANGKGMSNEFPIPVDEEMYEIFSVDGHMNASRDFFVAGYKKYADLLEKYGAQIKSVGNVFVKKAQKGIIQRA